MPYTNVPENLWGKMDSCVEQVQSDGTDKETAVAICYTSVVEAREAEYPWDQCIADQKARGYGDERAAKICGAIRARGSESRRIEASIIAPTDKTGAVWDIAIIGESEKSPVIEVGGTQYLLSANKRAYELDALKNSVPQWEGVVSFDNHLTDSEFAQRGNMRSVRNEGMAVIKNPRWDEERRCISAEFRVIDADMREKLMSAYDLGVIGDIGLSIDAIVNEGTPIRYGGDVLQVANGFKKILSVDIVASPAAGGRFNRVIAANNILEETTMTEYLTKEDAQAMIAEALAARSTEQGEMVNPEEAAAAVADVAQQAAAAVPPDATPGQAVAAVVGAVEKAAEEVAMQPEMESVKEQVRKLECALILRDSLDAAKLPDGLRRTVESAYAGRIFEKGDLMDTIKRAKEAQAANDASGAVQGAGGQRSANFAAVLSPRDKAEIGFLQLLNNTQMRALESNKADYVQDRISDAYRAWVNGGRANYRPRSTSAWLYEFVGNPLAMRATEANDVASITKNALNVMLAAEYSAKNEWWAPIVTEEEVTDINDATLVRDYGFENLDIVDEGAAYNVINLSDDEETASFVKHGNYVGVTLETMLKDKLGVLRNIPTKLANSWYNTLGAKVAAVFTTNSNTGPILSDGGALFNATAIGTAGGHVNLLTAALSFTAYGAARTAMLKQTDKKLGAGNRLLIEPRYLLVPVDLETTALQIRNSQYLPNSANNDVNPYYQQFDVVKVPQWTDATDWAFVADPRQWPAIFLIFVNGYRVPQIITAGDESGGAVFTNDTWRYKVRLMTYRYSATYDCAPVADFRPLHKSNVAG